MTSERPRQVRWSAPQQSQRGARPSAVPERVGVWVEGKVSLEDGLR